MNFNKQIKQIKKLKPVSGSGYYIAGGVLTSTFTNSPVNDIDIYPKTWDDMESIIEELFQDYHCLNVTDKSITFREGRFGSHNEDAQIVQVVCFDIFETPEKIFKDFDFTICMAAYDTDTDKIHMHEDFLIDCSRRILNYNEDTKFPFVSMSRAEKYKDRGYTIYNGTHLKMMMNCQNADISTWEKFVEQIGGYYGLTAKIPRNVECTQENVFKVLEGYFDDMLDWPLERIAEYNKEFAEKYPSFDLERSPLEVENYKKDLYHKRRKHRYLVKSDIENCAYDLDEVLQVVLRKPVRILEHKGKFYKLNKDNISKKIEIGNSKNPVGRDEIDEYFESVNVEYITINDISNGHYYKYVKKSQDGTYHSKYNRNFKYKIFDPIEEKNAPYIFVNIKTDMNDSSYHHGWNKDLYIKENLVVVEIVSPEDNVEIGMEIDGHKGQLRLNKGFVSREVPWDEWETWNPNYKKEIK